MAAAASAANGLPVSPLYDAVLFYVGAMLPAIVRQWGLLASLTSVFLGVTTFAFAGVTATAYERLFGTSRTTIGSAVVWLLAALVLAAPGLLGSVGYFDLE